MTEPLQAIVRDADGIVTDVLVCDAATAETFARDFPDLYPASSWHDATGLGVAVGWHYAGGEFTAPVPSPTSEDPGDAPTPTTPGTPANPGDASDAATQLRAQVAAQQESIDWLIDVVTSLATGGEIGGDA